MKAAVLIILSLLCYTANAQTLDLTIPPVDYNYCERNKQECDRIQQINQQTILPKFEFKEDTLPRTKAIFYALNVIDTWTSHRAISGGYGREKNPLLPNYPSLEELITHKVALIGLYEYIGFLNNEQIVITMNYGLGAVVANNLELVIDNEYR